jgi:hypothetical protein
MSVAQLLAVALTFVGVFLLPELLVRPVTETCRIPD